MRQYLFLGLASALLAAENPMVLQLTGVKTLHDGKEVLIEREIPKACINVKITPEDIFSGNYAGNTVPKECQKSIVAVVGKAQPMQLSPGIRTVGEVEVLDFIKNKMMVTPSQYILVDARKKDWYEQMTIPGSVNIPFDEIEYDEAIPEDFERVQTLLHFTGEAGHYDFSHAKTALIFCNGAWCVQSHLAIEKLLKIGYPQEKILWYRGGLQDWVLFGFTVVKPST